MRRAPQLGQKPRLLQLKATSFSSRHDSQRTLRKDLQLTLSDVSPGDSTTDRRLKLTIENLGNDTAASVTTSVRQGPERVFSATVANWGLVSSNGLACATAAGVSCTASALGVGETAEVVFDVSSYGPGFYQFDAQATHGGLDPWPMNNESSFGAKFDAAPYYTFSNGFE